MEAEKRALPSHKELIPVVLTRLADDIMDYVQKSMRQREIVNVPQRPFDLGLVAAVTLVR